jgi:hypothetical protein
LSCLSDSVGDLPRRDHRRPETFGSKLSPSSLKGNPERIQALRVYRSQETDRPAIPQNHDITGLLQSVEHRRGILSKFSNIHKFHSSLQIGEFAWN